MANREKGFGMTAELADKKAAKYRADLALEAMEWIQSYLPGEDVVCSASDDVLEKLKDGQILCKLINVLQPGSVPKINESKMAFKQMENIGSFLDSCVQFGCDKLDLFQTVDLYEGVNMPGVICGLHALGRKCGAKGMNGIGPKEAEKNEREFDEATLAAGRNTIGLQMGTNKLATQSGQNFGKSRMIID